MLFEATQQSSKGHSNKGKVPEEWKKANVTSTFKKGEKEGDQELEAGHPHLSPWKSSGANKPGSHFQTYEGQKDNWEWSPQIYHA